MSFFLGDFDLDFDHDFGFGDIFSLKGIIHFVIGVTLTLTLFGTASTVAVWAIAVAVGIAFVVILGWLYRFVYKSLKQEIDYEQEITNAPGEVYFYDEGIQCGEVTLTLEGTQKTLPFTSDNEEVKLRTGEKITVSGKRNDLKFIKKNS